MALEPNALIDVAYIESVARVIADADEARYEALINQASSLCEARTDRKLAAQPLDMIFDGTGKDTLLLPEYPIVSVTSVHIDATRQWGAEDEVTDYYKDDSLGILFRDSGWGWVRRSVRVQFTAGHETVPEDLKEACLEIVLWLAPRQKAGSVGLRGTKVDGQEHELEITIPLHAQQVLRSYRRIA